MWTPCITRYASIFTNIMIFPPSVKNIGIFTQLPNGLHYEWTMKALAAGKHVLLEKPSANTAEETRAMFELAERKGLVLLEAFHFRWVLAFSL
jgi:Oxidoreductase family, NAD-binding Rossmann fold